MTKTTALRLALSITIASMATGPSLAAPTGWDGWYVGVNLGGTLSEGDFATSGNTAYWAPINNADIRARINGANDDTQVSGGIQAGFNLVRNGWLVGAEVDMQSAGTSADRAVLNATYPGNPTTTYSTTAAIEQDYIASARIRAGMTTEHALYYVTGGLAVSHASMKHTFSDTYFPIPEYSIDTDGTLSGWTAGVGVECKDVLKSGTTLRLEYLHSEFDTLEVTASRSTGTVTLTGDVTDDVVRLGWNFWIN